MLRDIFGFGCCLLVAGNILAWVGLRLYRILNTIHR